MERANRTLQDRLVKEMRLRGIDGMEAANAYLPEFAADFNRRFGAAPREAEDAHRPVLHDAEELDLILCEQATRKLLKNLTFQFERRECQLVGEGRGRRLRGAAVTVCKGFDGTVAVLLDGRRLAYRVLAEGEAAVAVEDEKGLRDRVDAAKAAQAEPVRNSVFGGGRKMSPKRRMTLWQDERKRRAGAGSDSEALGGLSSGSVPPPSRARPPGAAGR